MGRLCPGQQQVLLLQQRAVHLRLGTDARDRPQPEPGQQRAGRRVPYQRQHRVHGIYPPYGRHIHVLQPRQELPTRMVQRKGPGLQPLGAQRCRSNLYHERGFRLPQNYQRRIQDHCCEIGNAGHDPGLLHWIQPRHRCQCTNTRRCQQNCRSKKNHWRSRWNRQVLETWIAALPRPTVRDTEFRSRIELCRNQATEQYCQQPRHR
mmetsp:Transcript_14997/g.32110  ORF Transcript_14997/g.32110 Transcript_14997/m.32110 type:complete len:206 (+) Transcript_14997:1223-1840(+)